MYNSKITIDVSRDENKMVNRIDWNATDSSMEDAQTAKALMLSFWDNAEKTALRIDLWTKDMMVDEMTDFFYQTFITMADTYSRATRYQELSNDMKLFAKGFMKKFRDLQAEEAK